MEGTTTVSKKKSEGKSRSDASESTTRSTSSKSTSSTSASGELGSTKSQRRASGVPTADVNGLSPTEVSKTPPVKRTSEKSTSGEAKRLSGSPPSDVQQVKPIEYRKSVDDVRGGSVSAAVDVPSRPSSTEDSISASPSSRIGRPVTPKKRATNTDDESNGVSESEEDALAQSESRLEREKMRLRDKEEKLKRDELMLLQQQTGTAKLLQTFSLSALERNRNEKERNIQESLDSIRKAREDLMRESQKYYRLKFDRGFSDMDDIKCGWMKMRDPFKVWHHRWFVLRPGKLLYYKSDLEKLCQGIVLLNGCDVHRRASKLEGFCFKIIHPKQNNIYSSRGLKGETLVLAMVPLSAYNCILRVDNPEEGQKWIESIQTAIAYTNSSTRESPTEKLLSPKDDRDTKLSSRSSVSNMVSGKDQDKTVDKTVKKKRKTIRRTLYLPWATQNPFSLTVPVEEEVAPEFKNVLVHVLKQVKPGMDLSRVTLPTFILEPRSTLEKISDFLLHADLLGDATRIKDPVQRMVQVTKWYLSGFYIRPKGVKKPYNPILGEHFRCMFKHPSGTETYFVAEQVSHHPPVSAFYASNRKDGYVVNCSILFRSKFMGTYIASILDGVATVYFTSTDEPEEYELTFPTAQARGFLFGTMVLELVGSVHIRCAKTGCEVDLEFKGKPLFGGDYNVVSGKIKQHNKTLYSISGRWDDKIHIKEANDTSKESRGDLFWEVTPDVASKRLPLFKPPFEQMEEFESDRLWTKVTQAILTNDQVKATEEKFVIEQAQREAVKERTRLGITWTPKLFVRDPQSEHTWTYRYLRKQPWSDENEVSEYEFNGVIGSVQPGMEIAGDDSEEEEEEEEGEERESDDEKDNVRSLEEELDDAVEDEVEEDSTTGRKWKRTIETRFQKLEKELLMVWQRQKTDTLRASHTGTHEVAPKRRFNVSMVVKLAAVLLVLYLIYHFWSRLASLEQMILSSQRRSQ